MGLLNRFRPRWKHSNADVRIAAIGELSDPQALTELIIVDGEWFVRHEAFAKLRSLNPDQAHYACLLRESNDEEIRRKTIKVMTDVPELERAAREDQYRYVRDAAEHRLEELRAGVWNNLAQ